MFPVLLHNIVVFAGLRMVSYFNVANNALFSVIEYCTVIFH